MHDYILFSKSLEPKASLTVSVSFKCELIYVIAYKEPVPARNKAKET